MSPIRKNCVSSLRVLLLVIGGYRGGAVEMKTLCLGLYPENLSSTQLLKDSPLHNPLSKHFLYVMHWSCYLLFCKMTKTFDRNLLLHIFKHTESKFFACCGGCILRIVVFCESAITDVTLYNRWCAFSCLFVLLYMWSNNM